MKHPIFKSPVLNNIPETKIQDTIQQICAECEVCEVPFSTNCPKCRTITNGCMRYADANIPIRYWNLIVDENFKGPDILKQTYDEVVKDLKTSYRQGVSICLAGNHGIGKTLVMTNILKLALLKGFSAHYSSLSDIVNGMTGDYSERPTVRNQLMTVDFLVIDEFDPRFMGSDNAAELFGRVLEDIFRSRAQNCLPIFMGTNSPNVANSFSGALKQSIDSLMNYVKIIPIVGKDFRREEKNG